MPPPALNWRAVPDAGGLSSRRSRHRSRPALGQYRPTGIRAHCPQNLPLPRAAGSRPSRARRGSGSGIPAAQAASWNSTSLAAPASPAGSSSSLTAHEPRRVSSRQISPCSPRVTYTGSPARTPRPYADAITAAVSVGITRTPRVSQPRIAARNKPHAPRECDCGPIEAECAGLAGPLAAACDDD